MVSVFIGEDSNLCIWVESSLGNEGSIVFLYDTAVMMFNEIILVLENNHSFRHQQVISKHFPK